MKPSPTTIICVTIVIALEVIGGGVGVIVHRDIGQLVTFFAIVNAAAIPALTALVKQEQTEKKVEDVNQKVNGHLSRLTGMAIESGQLPPDPHNGHG